MKNLIFCHNTNYLNDLYDKIKNEKKKYFENSVIFLQSEYEESNLNQKIKEKAITYIQKSDGFFPKFDNFEINSKILQECSDIELTFYSMFDYYEFDNFKIGSKDKRISYYYYLNNLINLVKKYNLVSVYFTHVPHTLVEVLVLKYFEKKNLKVIITRGLPIPELYKLENNISKIDKSDNEIDNYKDGSDEIIENFISKYKKNFDSLDDNNNWVNYNLIKSYNKLHTLKYFLLIIFPIFFTLKYFFRLSAIIVKSLITWVNDNINKTNKINEYINLRSIFYSKNNYIHLANLNKFNLEKIFYYGHLSKNKNLFLYKKLTKKIDFNERYFFFPMWFQPSSTTYPFAERYIDYELSLQILSKNLPDNFFIYVKESPDIFNISNHAWFKGNFTRDKKFYQNISKIPKVKLVDFKIKDFELIDNSDAVVSLSDKFSIISIIRNKPHISFVDTLCSKVDTSFYCFDENKLKEAINKILNIGIKFNDKENENFFKWLKKVSFYRSTNKGLNKMTFKNDFDKIAHILGKRI